MNKDFLSTSCRCNKTITLSIFPIGYFTWIAHFFFLSGLTFIRPQSAYWISRLARFSISVAGDKMSARNFFFQVFGRPKSGKTQLFSFWPVQIFRRVLGGPECTFFIIIFEFRKFLQLLFDIWFLFLITVKLKTTCLILKNQVYYLTCQTKKPPLPPFQCTFFSHTSSPVLPSPPAIPPISRKTALPAPALL